MWLCVFVHHHPGSFTVSYYRIISQQSHSSVTIAYTSLVRSLVRSFTSLPPSLHPSRVFFLLCDCPFLSLHMSFMSLSPLCHFSPPLPPSLLSFAPSLSV